MTEASNKNIIQKSMNKAIGGGVTGATAMFLQVTSLMWLRTTVNYQYRYGTTTTQAFKTLYSQGGLLRFYKGYLPALTMGPLSRFGDTAANVGVIHYLNSYEETRHLPEWSKTLGASLVSGLWRVNLMPIDTCKTIMQVEGKNGLSILKNKIAKNGIGVLYHGTAASFTANFLGSYPWFLTYNYLDKNMPEGDTLIKNFARNGFIGFSASLISDVVTNSVRVVKTTKQSFDKPISYLDTVKHVVKEDGTRGLFFRGLQTKIISNGLQSMMFAILWKYLLKLYETSGTTYI